MLLLLPLLLLQWRADADTKVVGLARRPTQGLSLQKRRPAAATAAATASAAVAAASFVRL